MSRAVFLCSCLLFCAHAWAGDASATSKLIDNAAAKYQKSETLGFAWRNAKLALEEARSAYDSKDYDQAQSSAEQSIRLSDAAIAQAEREADAWQTRPPFN